MMWVREKPTEAQAPAGVTERDLFAAEAIRQALRGDDAERR